MFYTAQLEDIPSGGPGLERKTRKIRQLVERAKRDPNFRAAAAKLLSDVREKDHSAEIGRLVRFVRTRVRYLRDPWAPGGLELFTDARTLLRDALRGRAVGDCDDHVILASALLETVGYQTRYPVGASAPEEYRHIWLEVLNPSTGWTSVDLTTKDQEIGWSPAGAYHHVEVHTGRRNDPMLGNHLPALPQSFQNVHVEPGVYAGSTPSDFFRAVAMRGNLPQGDAYAMLGEGHDLGGFFSDFAAKAKAYVREYGPEAAGLVAGAIGTPALGTAVYGVTAGARGAYEAKKAADAAVNVPMAQQPALKSGISSPWPSFDEVKEAQKAAIRSAPIVAMAPAPPVAAPKVAAAPTPAPSRALVPTAPAAAPAAPGFNPMWLLGGLGLLLLMSRR